MILSSHKVHHLMNFSLSSLEFRHVLMVIYLGGSKLLLNTHKTEVMTVGTLSNLRLLDCNILIKTSVRYLRVNIDHTLSMQDQISSICSITFLELRHLASIQPYFSKSTSARIVPVLITSRLPICLLNRSVKISRLCLNSKPSSPSHFQKPRETVPVSIGCVHTYISVHEWCVLLLVHWVFVRKKICAI